jgi:F-type H+-transporting ATPase subunit alpha
MGFLDDLPLNRVLPFEKALAQHIHDEFPEIREEILQKGVVSDELSEKIRGVLKNFKARFTSDRATQTAKA